MTEADRLAPHDVLDSEPTDDETAREDARLLRDVMNAVARGDDEMAARD